jgi:hypothetical protein
MGKKVYDDEPFVPRDRTRVRDGWKAERNAARDQKEIKRGTFKGKRVERAKGEGT